MAKLEYDVGIQISEKTIGRALTIIDWYLADHPDKTIIIEQEDDMRVCLIADREESNAEKQSV